MKKVIIALFLILSMSVTAFAAGEDIIEENTTVSDMGTNVYVDNNLTIAQGRDILTGVNTYAAGSVTPADTYGLKAAMLSLLGDYNAIVVEYEYTNMGDNLVTYERTVQPDFVWLCSAAVLLIFVYCLFKLGVAAWKR